MELSRILVTGASGYLGSNLIQELDSADVVCFSRRRTNSIKGKEFVIDDIAYFSDILSQIDSIQTVVHLAAIAHNKSQSIEEYYRVNYNEALKFARSAANSGVKRFIYISTVNVYGDSVLDRPYNELDSGSNLDAITQIRINFENSLLKLEMDTSMKVVIVRCPLIYSICAPANFSKFVKLSANFSLLPFGSFNSMRSYLSLDNFLNAIMSIINCKDECSGVYNLCDNQDISIREMSMLVAGYYGKAPLQIYIPIFLISAADFILGGIRLSRTFLQPFEVSCDKFVRDFGWKPVQSPCEHFLVPTS